MNRRAGYHTLKDQGRPLQMTRAIRCRVTPVPSSGRLVERRTIRNIRWRNGTAAWLYEEITIEFEAVGWAKFPDDAAASMVALEVGMGDTAGWARVDSHSVDYEEESDGS